MIANIITVSRILFSLAMILFPPSSVPFAVLYLLCGATDVLDGFVARKLHTESENGAMLDSAADLLFAVVYYPQRPVEVAHFKRLNSVYSVT